MKTQLLLIFVILVFGRPSVSLASSSLAVLLSSETPQYREALAGLQSYLQQEKIDVQHKVYQLSMEEEPAQKAVAELSASDTRLVIPMGSFALNSAVSGLEDMPIVACMVFHKEEFDSRTNVSGAYLDIPPARQFEWMGKILPKARRVGVLYNPEHSGGVVERAMAVSAENGYDLVARKVTSPTELPAALKSLSDSVDALWGINDPTVLNGKTAKSILLFSFRNKIPFIGLSEPWVKAGALYALDRKYHDMGAQCGEVVRQILQGKSVKEVETQYPRQVVYFINKKTAKQMKIDLPKSIFKNAQKVY